VIMVMVMEKDMVIAEMVEVIQIGTGVATQVVTMETQDTAVAAIVTGTEVVTMVTVDTVKATLVTEVISVIIMDEVEMAGAA